ncbi:hypothetical protein G7013_13055 [Pseudomonas viridiflava]|uniref:Acyl carrier protein n=1 Tax=Pseudomonas viridiflava TaxID=33069 RepID=A0A3M5PK96_PSEVI|nr:hypothetical protein [Pseudomonas viridiflava]MBA1230574.1 hypothetical protein [Pseudomonas viridiflava]RMT84848.1 hypothetical protein ALP40_01688 [Pseudomonas viridiflava]
MNREGIKQRVLDALGVILVDKAQIRDDATFKDLVLDDEDVETLFSQLGSEFNFEFPEFIRKRAVNKPQHLSLPMVVDLILLMQQDSSQALEGEKKKPGRAPWRR